MKKKWCSFVVLIGIITIIAACGKEEVRPVAINAATDTCEICNMAVVDDQHATQIVLENGKSIVFDDIGCMYEWLGANEAEKIAAKFVRDYNDKEWILVDDVTYVYNQSVKTPMAYNVISFKDKASAEAFATENEGSTLMTVNELAEHTWKRNHEMMQMKKNAMQNHSHTDDAEDSLSEDAQ